MMMTNKILIEEVEQLKNMFSRGEMEMPSFWPCLWPGVIIAAWNMVCAIISVGGGYLSVKFIFWVLVFPGVISLMILLGVASARSLFLSVPRSYRMRSQVYRFISREGANKQVISSQADSLIKISRIWADFFPANTSNQPI